MTESATENVTEAPENQQTPETAAEEQQTSIPNIEKNLFWDDVRIGFGTVRVGVLILLIGALLNVMGVSGFFSVTTILIGALTTLAGLHVCTSVPKETGAIPICQAALGCSALCFLCLVINYFLWAFFEEISPIPILWSVAAVLGPLGFILFALTVSRAAGYLKIKSFRTCSDLYFSTGALFGFLFALFTLGALYSEDVNSIYAFKVVFGILILGAGISLWMVLGIGRQTIALLFAGEEPEEGDLPLDGTEEEPVTAEGVVVADKPMEPVSEPYFGDEEWGKLHQDDVFMGGWIVKLLTVIFCIGVLIYAVVLGFIKF